MDQPFAMRVTRRRFFGTILIHVCIGGAQTRKRRKLLFTAFAVCCHDHDHDHRRARVLARNPCGKRPPEKVLKG